MAMNELSMLFDQKTSASDEQIKELNRLKFKLEKETASYNAGNQSISSVSAILQVFQKLFINEIDFSLDNNLNQTLWKNVVKNEVNKIQNLNSQETSRGLGQMVIEQQSIIRLIQGFYERIISILNQRLNPINDETISFINEMNEVGQYYQTNKQKRGALFLLQDCYVHLGDIFRYLANFDNSPLAVTYLEQADDFYTQASKIIPSNGQPYNQLAILASLDNNHFDIIYYWCKALDAKSKFAPAQVNLSKQLQKNLGKENVKLSDSIAATKGQKLELGVKYFLRLFSRIYEYSEDYPVNDQDFSLINELLNKVQVKSNYTIEKFIQITYLYLWLLTYCNDSFKEMVYQGFINFIETIAENSKNSKKLQPCIKLGIEWLDCYKNLSILAPLAERIKERFENEEPASFFIEKLAFEEDLYIQGMTSFRLYTEKVNFNKVTHKSLSWSAERESFINLYLGKALDAAQNVENNRFKPPPGLIKPGNDFLKSLHFDFCSNSSILKTPPSSASGFTNSMQNEGENILKTTASIFDLPALDLTPVRKDASIFNDKIKSIWDE